MNTIFITYRREDSVHPTGRIYDRLVRQFGRPAVFKDVDSIPAGVDFQTHIDQELQSCQVACVIIGSHWLNSSNEPGKRRLDDPADFVRLEIEALLNRKIPIIPVLVDDATMPRAEELPETLGSVVKFQAVSVRTDPDFSHDMERLIAALQNILRTKGQRTVSRRAAIGYGLGACAVTAVAATTGIALLNGAFKGKVSANSGGPRSTATPQSTATSLPTPPEATLRWRFPTGDQINSTPVVVGDTVIFGSEDNNIYALNVADGSQRWVYQTENHVLSSPTVANGLVYIGSYSGNLYAINVADGSLAWSYAGGWADCNPAYGDGMVYYMTYSHIFYGVNATTGKVVWQMKSPGTSGSPTVVGDTVYTSAGAHFMSVNAATGHVNWDLDSKAGIFGVSGPCVYDDGTIYVGMKDAGGNSGGLNALNPSDGAVKWKLAGAGLPTIVNGLLIGQNGTGLFAARPADGSLVWQTHYAIPLYKFAYDGGVLYAHGMDNYLHAFAANDGRFFWKVPLNTGKLVSQVAFPLSYPVVNNNVVFVGSYDSALYTYNVNPLS